MPGSAHDVAADDVAARRHEVLDVARRYAWHEPHSRQVARLALELFDQSRAMHGLGEVDRELLEYGALLHDIGDHVSADDHHKHTAYLIEHACLRGFSPDEVAVLASLGRFHRRGDLKTSYGPYRSISKVDRGRVAVLVSLLRIADGLDRSRRGVVRSLTLHAAGHLSVHVEPGSDAELERWSTERKAELFEDVFGCGLAIDVSGDEHLAAV